MLKKTIPALILSLTLMLTALPAASAATKGFSDVDSSRYYYDEVLYCAEQGYVSGYEDGTFRPENGLTRGEFATILNKVLGLSASAPNTFSDVANGQWYTTPVLNCVQAGVMKGLGNGYFGINDPVTREQAAVILSNAYQVGSSAGRTSFADDSSISYWAVGNVKAMTDRGYISGNNGNVFNPQGNLTRGQVCLLLCKCKGVSQESLNVVIESVAKRQQESKQLLGSFQITAYEWDGTKCANGRYPTEGYTVACNSLPLGTRVYIEGIGERVVEDRGATWHSDSWMDLYLGDVSACNEFGVQYRNVYVISYP